MSFIFGTKKNFDFSASKFAEQAYSARKYAFVSDYVRVYALEKYGGIYLDTDIEVIKTFDDLLEKRLVLGTDDSGNLTAFMASERMHPFFTRLKQTYDDMEFFSTGGKANTTVNNVWMQNVLVNYGYKKADKYQSLDEGIEVYPCTYFHAKSLISGKLLVSQNTYCIHHHTLLWVSKKTRIVRFLRMKLFVPILGAEVYEKFAGTIKSLIGRH